LTVDRRQLTTELCRFYDFSDKVVLYVGAGRGQLLDASAGARKRIVVDQDNDSLQKLQGGASANAEQGAIEIIDIVVFEHTAGSRWSYYAAEENEVRRAACVLRRHRIRRQQTLYSEQRFRTFDELLEKLAPQGMVAINRAQRFAGAANIMIPMECELVLI